MRQFLRGVPFFGFVALALVVAAAARWGNVLPRRRLVNLFLCYTLAVSFAAGLLQREAWPFSTWPLVAGIHPAEAVQSRLLALDRLGQEKQVDYRAWRPFVVEELMSWTRGRMLTLDPQLRAQAAEHLLQRVEHGIAQVRAGDTPGDTDRFWGPLTAPYFLLHPVLWRTPADVPEVPLTGLRLYEERWNLEERLRNPSAVERTLLFEYRRP